MDEVIAAYGILRIKAIRMYVALVNFDTFLVLMLGNLDEPAEVDAITAEVRLNSDTPSLHLLVYKPLWFRHCNLLKTFGLSHVSSFSPSKIVLPQFDKSFSHSGE